MKLEDGCRLDSIQPKNSDRCRENVEILFDSAGRIVCEFSKRKSSNGSKYTREISKATKDFLVEALFDEHQDENFVHDFLLTKSLINVDSHYLLETLIERCALHKRLIDRVFPIVFLWVNKFFTDFQYSAPMKYSLLKFVELLENEEMRFRASRLEQICSDKSLCRRIKIDSDDLNAGVILFPHYSNLCNFDIFVKDLLPSSLLPYDESFLMPGDQILSLNGVNICSFRGENEFMSKLKSTKRSTLVVKWNLLNFKKAFYGDRKNTWECMKHSKSLKHNALGDLSKNNFFRSSSSSQKDIAGTIGKLFKKITNSHREFHLSKHNEWRRKSMGIKKSRSNPDMEIHSVEQSTDDRVNDLVEPDFIIKVFRSDQSFKYFPVFKETTAQNVVQLALQEFGLSTGQESSFNWALYEVSSREDGATVQKCLSNLQNDLSDRLDLNSRYYLKNLHCQEQLLPDHYKQILRKASAIRFLNLNDEILAKQLCLRDFELFAAIDPSDYIWELTNDPSDETKIATEKSREKLNNFEKIFNTESLWVAYEILGEKNESKRLKMMKKFVKIAKLCFEWQNYNSTFAIVCGLEKPCVKRLQSIWDRLPPKYKHILHDLHSKILDPSRNMARYRSLLDKAAKNPPVLPIFPIILKDLFFLSQYNKTYVDDIGEKMINFSKLKMISENLQFVSRLTSKCYANGSQEHNYLENETLSYSTSYANKMLEYFPISNVIIDRQSLSAKKSRYDLIQMKKKCRTYLQNLGVLGNDVLDQFESKEIGSPNRNVLIDRSPCLSDSSSIRSETSSRSQRSKLARSEPPSPANQTKIQMSPRLIMLSSSGDQSSINSSSPSILSGGLFEELIRNITMHGWSNFASIAKTALTNAQKKIDNVLDIREDEKNNGENAASTSVNINKLKDEFFTAFGLQSVAIATTNDEDASSSSKTSITPTESPRLVRKSSKVKSSGNAWSSWLNVELDKSQIEDSSEPFQSFVEDTIARSGEKTPTPFDQSLPINTNIFDSFVNSNTDIDPAFLSPTADRLVISSNSKLALLDCNTIQDSLTTCSKEEDKAILSVASDVLCDTRISDSSSDRNDVLMCMEEILQVATRDSVAVANVESQSVYHSPTYVCRRESNGQTVHTQKLSGYSSPNGCNFDDMETNASSDIEVMSTPNGDNGSECSSLAIIQSRLTVDDSVSHYVPEQSCLQRKSDILRGRRSSAEHNDERKFEQLSKIIEMRERRLLDISNENVKLRIENDSLRSELKEISQDRPSGWKSTLERDYQSISKEKCRLEQRIDFLEKEMLVRVSLQQFQQVVADKDRQIKELMEEGEKLAKKELKANNVVKKLRETEVGHLKTIKSLNEKQQEMENMKKKLKEKEERELKYDSTVCELRDIIEKQEKAIDRLRKDFEDSEEKSTGYRNAMTNLNNENIELQKKIAHDVKEIETLKSTIDESRNADLAEKFETAELEKESMLAKCRKEIDALKNQLDNCQMQHELTEQSLKNDAKRLELKVQEVELRNHQLIDNTTCATRPLIQQIESLQTSIRNQEAQFERVEKSLFQKLVQAEKDCAVWKEKEQNLRTFIEEYKYNISKQDNESSILRNEIKRLKQDLSKSEGQVSTLKEAKEKLRAELEKETLLRIRYTEDIQKEKEILISQFEFEKNHFKGVLDQSMRDLQANLNEKEMLVKSLQEELTDFRMKQQSGMRHESSLSNRLSESSAFDTIDDVYELPQGSYATVLEHLRAKLQERERDLWICKEERKSMQMSRDSLMASLTLITEEKNKMEEFIKLHENDEREFKALKKSYDALLQMYGEKVEENEELRLDLVDVKVLYKQHLVGASESTRATSAISEEMTRCLLETMPNSFICTKNNSVLRIINIRLP